MKKIALITLHGMGEVDDFYYADLESNLVNELGTRFWDKISFQNVQYAPVTQVNQTKLWNAMRTEPENDLDYMKLRKFMLYGFSDASGLEHSAHHNQKEYRQVQAEIQRALTTAFTELGGDPTKPVVIIAHSLGCQVISNYIWDSQQNKFIFEGTEEDDSNLMQFLRLESLTQLTTTGCNIPLFIGGLEKRRCFDKPNRDDFSWDNFYDADDVLGWPLRQLGKSYNFVKDHPINAGGLHNSWNPFSHSGYWKDKDVIEPLADRIRLLLV